MVFVLRADEHVTIDYKSLSSAVTGWDMQKAVEKGKRRETRPDMLFERIRKAHYNINTHRPIREKQKKALLTRDCGQDEKEAMKQATKDEESKAKADLKREETMGRVERIGQDLLTPAVHFSVLKQGADIEGFCSLEGEEALAGG
jgi:hypothetical protein